MHLFSSAHVPIFQCWAPLIYLCCCCCCCCRRQQMASWWCCMTLTCCGPSPTRGQTWQRISSWPSMASGRHQCQCASRWGLTHPDYVCMCIGVIEVICCSMCRSDLLLYHPQDVTSVQLRTLHIAGREGYCSTHQPILCTASFAAALSAQLRTLRIAGRNGLCQPTNP
jgi:hypothetical protein